ncbi:dTDP-6-deoxy-L-hexose 3-O-methyltransferase [Cohnella sp. CIP 111063]|uniref:TylF/MycF/NovP-related O-methyltransferase n=1 Tax=unclassified Cohnella TaxID=2636738 RepID=UPI000B8C2935|nr:MULTISPECIES: TylF/MycF/NovP-related O-methyltransferase [unclassified Cohnella]OXS55868.1 dTDP-6-deoxy-L-hexose 3-O-methyltransferase [Cohnella sp. CIP 111063]
MITLPDFSKAFEYENQFYLSCDITRISKMLAHYELFKMVMDLPGAVVECGVFKGASLLRFSMFRELLSSTYSKKIIGFDIFGKFPETNFEEDVRFRKQFIDGAGENSIAVEQLQEVLDRKGINKQIELVKGDITETVPDYVRKHPELKISLLNLDTDIYEPCTVILEHLYPRLVKGGILIIDDYGTFPGETKAIDDYFKGKDVIIRKFPFAMTPCYLIKI